ncbi:MAG: hypothetical protein A3H71_02105 [Candidatus Sungbacteria bacterium RIFCSPLOWO2_02_FULL_48_13b]|uniref:Uncharacterized protein n=2 Tax=Candidatus Sungiibacteriota TaxID=1817917 RepID=A0A1G2LF64_9BACT|nr:MAG: hypothetical protein A3C12_01505 [Candidatus Sungbacteria bacterium RIFCSPHIGHO2_02_FULL_49_20]OHA10275.1 MAG: hypothetical protein A3H71_02105 [Candidatus Sungbacteria bacterium RIFCSPLOWO2_02_FULL_48_13b]
MKEQKVRDIIATLQSALSNAGKENFRIVVDHVDPRFGFGSSICGRLKAFALFPAEMNVGGLGSITVEVSGPSYEHGELLREVKWEECHKVTVIELPAAQEVSR